MNIKRLQLNTKEINTLEKMGVVSAILFGSRVTQTTNFASDYDIGILVKNPADLDQKKRKLLHDIIYDLLSNKIRKLTNIDIVFLDEAPMELRAHVVKYGIPIYESDNQIFARFCEYVIGMYADFAPLRKMFHKQMFKMISI